MNLNDGKRRLEKVVVLVTGAGGGIGRAVVARLLAEGARVVATDVSAASGAELLADHRDEALTFAVHDVSSEQSWIEIAAFVRDRHDRMDALVNNAGIGTLAASIVDVSLEQWRQQQSVNLEGTFLGIKHCLPLIRQSGAGSILNICSVVALRGVSGMAAYSATKGGIRALSRAVAAECIQRRDGVRVNAIMPGMIATPALSSLMDEDAAPPQTGGQPANDFLGTPQDVAAAAAYLLSDDGRHLNGSEIVVDGGRSAI